MICRDRVKVGKADNVLKRQAELQTGSPDLISIAFAQKVQRHQANQVEKRAHELLAERRIRGEWFEVTPDEARAAVTAALQYVAEGEVNDEIGPFIVRGSKTEVQEALEAYPEEVACLMGYDRRRWY